VVQTCADGSVQRDLYNKSETSSPTVSNEALMYAIIDDAKERRDVATTDVVQAYLNADMVDFTLMKLTGDAVNIVLKVDELYSKFVTTENGKEQYIYNSKKGTHWLRQISPSLVQVIFGNTTGYGF
jgi:hypothetical protein